ncbi:DUF4241 domain-containing protein [Planktothrix sp. FACHB-1365]|uniref:DUF4241 domain-containing protein n=1 Tax=Planktothrix sp. FACHB-1365 TaxID=2692855 RepID=UPI0016883C73|nr:DUF4241 domain-containing protein [Planktothrix sp. FACHB-1365]MBD2481286.1 DUF4241 domain-containing protein [Planktothrix sp. FACHB-1365]
MNPTDLTQAFPTGYWFPTPLDHQTDQVTYSVQTIGELVVTTGKIAVCDPLVTLNPHLCLTQPLPVGRYPVKLSIATFHDRKEQRVACAMLVLHDQPAVTWELAACFQGESEWGYPVDSGTGCFMDGEVVQRLSSLSPTEFETYYHHLDQTLDQTYLDTWDWANFCLEESTGLNIIAFHSGWGEGCYPSYWGYDQQGNPVCLVTDFKLFELREDQ